MKSPVWVGLSSFAGNASLVVPKRPNDYWLLGLSFKLTTDATAGTRTPRLFIAMGSTEVFIVPAQNTAGGTFPIGGTATGFYFFAAGSAPTSEEGLGGTMLVIPLPVGGYHVGSDHQLKVSIYGGAAGDSATDVFMLVAED